MFKIWDREKEGACWLPVKYERFTFSGGEVHVKLEKTFHGDVREHLIDGNITSSYSFMELALLTDCIRRRYPKTVIHLVCPYLPYARQDRACAPGEAFSLKVFSTFLNSLNFASVTVWDAHSDVSLALVNNVENKEQYNFLYGSGIEFANTVLVAPDGGSLKKVFRAAQEFQVPYITAEKHRDPRDGKITGTSVHMDLSIDRSKNFLIVDDICDGGRTFIELAKVLQQQVSGKLLLYVTHGIFSQGLAPLLEWFDHIYVANCFLEPDGGPDWNKVTILFKENQ